MNYYYELNKLIRFYEGIQIFQKNAEKFLSKSNSFNNYDNCNEPAECGNNKNNGTNIELRLNLLKSYYINGNFAAIKAHIENFEKTCNINEFVEKFKLNAFRLNTTNINNAASNDSSAIDLPFRLNTTNINNAVNKFLKKIIAEYYNVIIIGNEYLSAFDKSVITKQILIYLEIFNTVNSLKTLINTATIDRQEIDNDALINTTIDRQEIDKDKIKYKNCHEPEHLTYIYKYNYTPFLFDLCKYLYEFKEYEKLTFFYNMMNFSKKIYNDFKITYIADDNAHIEKYGTLSVSETFEEFDKLNYQINGDFDETAVKESNAAYNDINSKFFDILSMWESRTKNYYTRDEIFFSAAMFIIDEYIPVLSELYNDTGNGWGGGLNSDMHSNINDFSASHNFNGNHHKGNDTAHSKKINKNVTYSSCRIKNSSGKISSGYINSNPVYYGNDYLNGNIYTDDNIAGMIKANYSNALKLFKKAIALNSCNPDYYLNYAECLKKSGRVKDAEIFFKKAFEFAL